MTDGFGWCYTAYCSATCTIEKKGYSCATTPSPEETTTESTESSSTASQSTSATVQPTTSAPTTASTATPTTTTSPDCTYLDPPRKNGETWKVDNCTTATCTDGKVIKTTPQCGHVEEPTCESGRSPVMTYDESGCCFTYSCECSCAGWSGSHYLTFDGNAYTFSDSCSYILVQEILSPNLKIVLDKHCSVGSSFCPESVIITYNSQQVLLTQSSADANVVKVDNKQVYPAFKNVNFIITSTGMEITVVIPEIEVQVTYTGSTFNIDLPDTLFHNNTEGLCGTCDNNKDNDCKTPSGQLGICSEIAPGWQVPGDTCETPTTPTPITTTTIVSPGSTAPPCQPSICEIIYSPAFEDCRKAIPPEPYAESCKVDVCTTKVSGCTSLQAYASACGKKGFCVDWRNYTNGECEVTCPATKVYKPCGPAVEPTCNSQYNSQYQVMIESNSTSMSEGCFCEPGTILFSAHSGVCVTSCACTGPDGSPKMPNDTWQNGCQMCECDGDTLSIQCKPVTCPTAPTPVCDKPGEVLVNKTDGCCQSYECQCDISYCVHPTMACPLGFTVSVDTPAGACCPEYTCKPTKVCVDNTTVYQPGSPMPSNDVCKSCQCGTTVDPETELMAPDCVVIDCNPNCQAGYEYQPVAGQCCGTCVRTSCVIMINNTVNTFPVNETFTPPDDNCVKYKCEEINGEPVAVETKTTCPPFNPDNCVPGTETSDADGCCLSCTLKSNCNIQKNSSVVVNNGCTSITEVELTSCEGSCGTSSMYSAESNTMMHSCSCCQEQSTSKRQVELLCPDGSKVSFSYVYIESCGCEKTECQSAQRRRRRR